MRGKDGQFNLSFGFIVSIILIIIFLVFAFFVIQKFLGLQKEASIGLFINDFESDIDKMWKSSQGSQQTSYSIPLKVEYICFADFSIDPDKRGSMQGFYDGLQLYYKGSENLFFYPPSSAEGMNAIKIEHINITEITKQDNPYCIKTQNGKVTVTIKKGYGESQVEIK
jgi:hypothetical protein